MARIALVTVPFYSHVQAAARLGGVLVDQGHEVTFWAPEDHRIRAQALGARFVPHSPEMPRGSGFQLAAAMIASIERSAEELVAQLQAAEVDLVVRDAQALWGLVAAEYLGIPEIVLHPLFPGGRPPDGARAPECHTDEAQARRNFEATWRSIARRWGVELAELSGIDHRGTAPTLVLTIDEIVGPGGLPPRWACIGPLMPPPLPRHPPGTRPLVFASLGTSHNTRRELFRTVIDALGGAPFDVLVSTGGGPVKVRDLDPLPSNVDVREFVCPREVLAETTVHITHGGCNSVHESLLAEVPLICLPQRFDQLPLSERIEQLGVGYRVPEEPGAIRAAVEDLVTNGDRARLSALSQLLGEYDGPGQVGRIVTAVLAEESVY